MSESALPLLMSAGLLGLLGSVHCLAMCGGIAGALGQALPASSWVGSSARALLYSSGRITSYMLAGAAAGALGQAFAEQTGRALFLRILAGLLIALVGLHVSGFGNGLAWVERGGLALWRRVSPIARRIGPPDAAWKVWTLGMLWGWLPCGLVYSALAGAAASGRAEIGAAFMLCFGLGTLPALLPASIFAERLGRVLSDRSARRAAGVLLIVFGIWSASGALMAVHHGSGGSHPESHSEGHGGPPAHESADAQGDPSDRLEIEPVHSPSDLSTPKV